MKLSLLAFLLILGAALFVQPAEAQTLTYDRVYALAADAIGHGPGAHYATRIAYCESRHDASAYSAGFDRRFGVFYEHVGLFQVENRIWGATAWREFGGSLWEPRVNAGMMGLILKAQGWNAWPFCSRNA